MSRRYMVSLLTAREWSSVYGGQQSMAPGVGPREVMGGTGVDQNSKKTG